MKKRVLLDFFPKLFSKQKLMLALLLITLVFNRGYGQIVGISGTVKDETGVLLPGVAVNVKGGTMGTVTNLNGEFKLKVPANATLVFKYIGFTPQEVAVGSKTTFNIVLKEDISKLDEVVVVGYGTQAKRDVAAAINNITEKDIEQRAPVNIFDAIQGGAPGVQIISNSGAPGESADIRVRGASTFEGGVAPLYIVDGVPQDDITTINPNDVKSIDILKDAASAAIYGSRSANGVIIITTKSGVVGKPKIDFNYLRSTYSLANKISQANRIERLKIFNNRTKVIDPSEGADSLYIGTNASNDYLDLITQTGNRDQFNFQASGATKDFNYLASLGYQQEEGIVIESWAKRLTGRFNIKYNLAPKLTLNSRLNFGYRKANAVNEGTVIAGAIVRPPEFILFYPDGSYAYLIAGVRNPLAQARFAHDYRTIYEGTIYQNAEYSFNPNFKFQTSITADLDFNRSETFSSKVLNSGNPPIGSAGDNNTFRRYFMGDAYFSYNKTINKNHAITALLGTSAESDQRNSIGIEGSRFVTESVETLNSLQDLDKGATTTDATANRMISFFTRLNYSYKGKYILGGTLRRDGSSRFTTDKWGTFPAVQSAWRISEEKFMGWARNAQVDDAKFRVSWGKTGNERIGDFETINRLILGGDYTYNNVGGVVQNTRFGNPGLSWETSTSSDFGFDLSMFKGRFSAVVDYYVKSTDKLLYSAKMPTELGYNDIRINLGAIQNKGLEVTLTGYPVRTAKFSWQTSVNYSKNKNTITALAKADYVQDSKWYVGVGRPVGEWYGFRNLGVYQYDVSNAWTSDYKTRLVPVFQRDANNNVVFEKSGSPVLVGYQYPNGTDYGWDPNTKPVYQMYAQGNVSKGGDVIWENLPGSDGTYNNQIDDSDRQVLGNAVAKWFGAWQNTFTYKNFSLFVNMYGSFGNLLYNKQRRDLTQYSSSNATPWPYDIRNAWKYQGQITDVPIAFRSVTDNSRELSSYFLEDGSFIRLRNARLGYRLDNKIAKKLYMSGLTAYLYGTNLLTWTNYTGFDPEFGGGVLTPGQDTGKFPRNREFGLGLNINF